MTESSSSKRPDAQPRVSMGKVASASLIGTSIEWYDFYTYATAAALVFGKLFFPNFSPVAGTLAAFSTYAVGFISRPVGSMVFGHFGDRIGRKRTLVVTLLIMGIATCVVGLLPTYAAIGVWAPVLLFVLRFVQGFAVGGEWGGAVLLAVEHAPAKRRVFYGSFPQLASSVGLLLSSLVFDAFSSLGDSAFGAWGWRIPFFLSAVLVVVGLVIRLKVEETPAFQELKATRKRAQLPVLEVFRSAWVPLLFGAGAIYVTIGGFYIITTFMESYATSQLAFSRSTVLTAVLATSIVGLIITPIAGWLGDRYRPRPVIAWSFVLTILSAFPLFWLAQSGTVTGLWIGMFLPFIGSTISYAAISALVASWFVSRIRYSAISMSYQLAGAIGGGLTPLIAQGLFGAFGNSYVPVAAFLIFMAAVSLVCVLGYRGQERLDEPVGQVGQTGST